jgi:hypothetical protein
MGKTFLAKKVRVGVQFFRTMLPTSGSALGVGERAEARRETFGEMVPPLYFSTATEYPARAPTNAEIK